MGLVAADTAGVTTCAATLEAEVMGAADVDSMRLSTRGTLDVVFLAVRLVSNTSAGSEAKCRSRLRVTV